MSFVGECSLSGSRSSTCGETNTSGRSGGSSRKPLARQRRRERVAPPPEPMKAMEKLQLVRCSLTRLRYLCERYRHMMTLDTTDNGELQNFFRSLSDHMTELEHNPRAIGKSIGKGPRHLLHMNRLVKSLLNEATTLLPRCEERMRSLESTYKGLGYHQLQDVCRELEGLQVLLSRAPSEMLSTRSTELLFNLVSIHVDDFDSLSNQRLQSFVREVCNEGALPTYAVKNTEQSEVAVGLVSVFPIEVAIGVFPGKSARIVIQHAHHNLHKIESRILKALQVLEGTSVPDDEAWERQRRELKILQDRVKESLGDLDRIKSRWTADEEDIFKRASSKEQSLLILMETKQARELAVVEEVQVLHDHTVRACLLFASPQYCRWHGETYSQPCHVRIGYKFIGDDGTGSGRVRVQKISVLMPEFYTVMKQQGVSPSVYDQYTYLVPSQYEMWVGLAEFPEMVMSVRCPLRGLDPRNDYPRAMEEQKEVGGYFVMHGGERLLRTLVVQRANVPINVERKRFSVRDASLASKAIFIRCKRPSGLSVLNYFYYSTTGQVIFSFSRKVVWQIPASLLLFSMNCRQHSSIDIFRLLTIGIGNVGSTHAARVEAFLQHHYSSSYGNLVSYLDFLAVLGFMYRNYHAISNSFRLLPQYQSLFQGHHDSWYGLFLLRRHVLPHLNVDEPTPDLAPGATLKEIHEWLTPKLVEELNTKFDAIIAIIRQLFGFYLGITGHQGNDVLSYQEAFTVSQVLIGGFEVCLSRLLKVLTYRMATSMPSTLFSQILRITKMDGKGNGRIFEQLKEHTEVSARRTGSDGLATLNRLLLTGNFILDRDEDFFCPQRSGWVVVAEHLNFYRFIEQFRGVHRGKSIAEMRSSEVRKYPCEGYGFLCMVHSPDGEDCGVLNHLSLSTVFSSSFPADSSQQMSLLASIQEELKDVRNFSSLASIVDQLIDTVPVWLEGKMIGYIEPKAAEGVARTLLRKKLIKSRSAVDATGMVRRCKLGPLNTVEVIYIPPGSKDPPGLYIFYSYGRLMRPVLQIVSESHDKDIPFPLVYLGTWEQTWKDIAAVPSDLLDGVQQLNRTYEFMEQTGFNILSLTSSTIPFFEHNCSPRNLFQCGLSKQTAGTQLQSMLWRKEAKLFQMYCPQRYISRTLPMDYYGLDDVSLGVNAVVAILAHTGYDLDDAIIVNSTASQLGMFNACITVAKVIVASGTGERKDVFVFHNRLPDGKPFVPELDAQGLPRKRAVPGAGSPLSFDTDHSHPSLRDSSAVFCCARRFERVDPITRKKVYEYTRHHVTRWRHFDKGEDGWVANIVPLTYDGPDPTAVLFVFRIPRPPAIGDKFSSRHGQKGTLPLNIRAYDLPFTSRDGISPDVIINPHAFPSRMTVGMVLEMMGAKLGALHGRFYDHSAWSVVGDDTRFAGMIGEALESLGYNRYGREKLIDGVSGEEIEAEVFMGISGYQRLRHMVNDKWQARARTDSHTHRAVTKTGQPVKGRKRHGGVRVGEMERDALLAHGVAEVVVDRLLHVSDKTKAFICVECGSMLSIYERHATEYSTWKTCKFCNAGLQEANDTISFIEIPQVLRLWAAELTSVGIRVVIKTSEALI